MRQKNTLCTGNRESKEDREFREDKEIREDKEDRESPPRARESASKGAREREKEKTFGSVRQFLVRVVQMWR